MKTLKIFSIVIMFTFALSVNAVNFNKYVGFASKYLWRGQNVYDGIVMQPGFDLGFHNFSFGFWSSYSMQPKQISEADYTFTYSTNLKQLSVTGGFTYYTFPAVKLPEIKIVSKDTSKEVFASFAPGNIKFNPAASIYYDFSAGNGVYLEGGFTIPVKLYFSFNTDFTVGYNFGQWGYKNSPTVISVMLSRTFSVAKFEIIPNILAQLPLNNQYSDDVIEGLTLNYNF